MAKIALSGSTGGNGVFTIKPPVSNNSREITLPDLDGVLTTDATAVRAGAVMFFAMATPPEGWLVADGSTISRTTYSKLFAAIGTTFGTGDGSTTFKLPDLRGEFLRGWDNGRGVDPGRAFGGAQLDEFKSHFHLIYGQECTGSPGGSSSNEVGNVEDAGDPKAYFNRQSGATGGSETRPRNVALLPCIKY